MGNIEIFSAAVGFAFRVEFLHSNERCKDGMACHEG